MTPNEELMTRVVRICGPLWDAISPPQHPTSSFPKSFIMALTAGETGAWLIHNADVPARTEQAVYNHLLGVQNGTERNYGAITQADLTGRSDLHDLASSWSLTQIMGYFCIPWKCQLSEIQNPATHYNWTLRLLDEFEHSFWLDPAKDFMEFARCWNSGNPHGKTYDPNYAQNVVDRMEAYQSLGLS